MADMAWALREGGKLCVGVELAYHVLGAMLPFEDSSREGLGVGVAGTGGWLLMMAV